MIAATVTGTVGRDAELRQPRGEQVLSFSIASPHFAGGQKSTQWVAVSFWGKRAVALASHVTKGSRVAVRGALHIREYEKTGGGLGWSIELRADDVELLGGRRDGGDGAMTGRQRPDDHDDHDDHGGSDDIPF